VVDFHFGEHVLLGLAYIFSWRQNR
jgi:hypothetical protein